MKNELRILKAQKTKLLNRKCETIEEFEEAQNKLNEIEFEMLALNENHILYID